MPLIVDGNGVDVSRIYRMSEHVAGNVGVPGSRSAIVCNNAPRNQTGQSMEISKKHVLRQYRACPFVVPMSLHSKELKLLDYIMDERLDKW